MDWLTQLLTAEHWRSEYVVRLLAASVLGAVIGLEREYHGRSAGFRTQLLVGLGAALVMLVSLQFIAILGGSDNDNVRADVARAIGGVMGGIGFLGAGVIFRQPLGIRGLTTAASLWCTAAVGLACGLGMYITAGVTTAIVLFALLILGWLEERLPFRATRTITMIFEGEVDVEAITRRLDHGTFCRLVELHRDHQSNELRLVFQLSISSRTTIATISQSLQGTAKLKQVTVN